MAVLISFAYINMGCALDLDVMKSVLKRPIGKIFKYKLKSVLKKCKTTEIFVKSLVTDINLRVQHVSSLILLIIQIQWTQETKVTTFFFIRTWDWVCNSIHVHAIVCFCADLCVP